MGGIMHIVKEYTTFKDKELPTFEDIYGMKDLKALIKASVLLPFQKPEIYEDLKIEPGCKILFFGAPGCGKTFTSLATAGEMNARVVQFTPSDTRGSSRTEPEKAVSNLFSYARQTFPSVILMDEAESLLINRDKYKDAPWAQRVLLEVLNQLDDSTSENETLILMASTNAPWLIDPAALRHGRFDRIIFIPPPDRSAREQLIKAQFERAEFGDSELERILDETVSLSVADLVGGSKRALTNQLPAQIANGEEPDSAKVAVSADSYMEAIKTYPSSASDWLKNTTQRIDEVAEEFVSKVSEYLKNPT